ncbi:6,7-dimethyl-8-ribityllumazine synthase [Blastopirellula retiformator]|uniref:6,7-dimethyl-8-ribityllumazine synthase n=1 Tax=Blastopirellula retiformator TaxID=2527970 RepID=A0A5C5V1Z7_9BACT|nr:6,7-dimethyl-8-ribityllumazine synthase [Blastopirellula retiformator]TWT31993.1 6,7-dimethyl-8-ribityllumazine synthase [Blastopirellula retiformator]
MVRTYRGELQGEAVRVAIVVARYNETITGKLCDGALATLAERGVADDAIEVAWVPGAWELPVVAARMARSGQFHAVICLGAVIKGETTHDQYINSQVSDSLGQLALECELPVMFGVLTVNTLEQALHRAGGNVGNKGSEAADAALEMVHLMKQLPREE